MGNNQAIKFFMNRIIVDQFAILSNVAPEDQSSVQFGINIEFSIDTENHVIACKMDSIFKDGDDPFMKLNTQCYFTIEPSDWDLFKQSDNTTIIPQHFLSHITMHTIGTSRGILHVKTESTPFNNYIIPPINVEEIIKEDLILE